MCSGGPSTQVGSNHVSPALGDPQKAIERGCTNAHLDTFSFQARPFYEKLGYRVFGTLENHPAGHQHYFMTKSLVLPQ